MIQSDPTGPCTFLPPGGIASRHDGPWNHWGSFVKGDMRVVAPVVGTHLGGNARRNRNMNSVRGCQQPEQPCCLLLIARLPAVSQSRLLVASTNPSLLVSQRLPRVPSGF